MGSKYWVVLKKLNNVFGIVSTDCPTIIEDLYNYMSIYAYNYKFQPKYKAGVWDGKIHFVTKSGVFPIGLLRYIYKFVKSDDFDIKMDSKLIERFDASEDLLKITNTWLAEELHDLPLVLRESQIEGTLRALKYRRGILRHATGSGKSLVQAMTIMYLYIKKEIKKALILVPTINLVHQMYSDFESYGVPSDLMGKFYGLEKETDAPITISTWQSMLNQTELIKTFDMLMVDECHSLKSRVCKSVSDSAINANIRIACTGTMPDNKCDCMLVESVTGPVIHEVTSKELIEQKHISDILIKVLFVNHPANIEKDLSSLPYDSEKKWLETCDNRNNIIKYIVQKHIERDHNVMILVDHLDHADVLINKFKQIPDSKLKIHKLTGKVKGEDREIIRNLTNASKRVALVGTYGVLSTGVSINRIHAVILASVGKSKIRLLQSIGRGLRLHKEKNKLILYDIADGLKFSEKHMKSRLGYYDKEEYEYNIEEIENKGINNDKI